MQPFLLLLLKAKVYVSDILGEVGFSGIGLESYKDGAVGVSVEACHPFTAMVM